MLELELVIKELREELNAAITEKDDSKEQAKTEKEELEEVGVCHIFCISSVVESLTKANFASSLCHNSFRNTFSGSLSTFSRFSSGIYNSLHYVLADKQDTKRRINETNSRACRSKGGD